ncbi:MAG: 2-octaprenyl-6-methoxyphenyl hydroxylase [Gammaproteobacteria bacterium]
MQERYDLLIAGGGLAGNCLALALRDSGLNLAVIEANTRAQQKASPAGDRALALSAGTVAMLDALGIWQGIRGSATPIKGIHISDQGHFGKTRLSAAAEKVDALGYVITARELEGHVSALVAKANIELISPARVTGLMTGLEAMNVALKLDNESVAVSATLLVGADGGLSTVRNLLEIGQIQQSYGQTALVATVESTLAHHNMAYERFTPSGPLALLPVGSRHSALVWTRSTEDAEALMLAGEDEFIAELQRTFGYKLGALSLTAPRRAFPLSLIRAETMVSARAIIIGNAVHQLHPVAGQGFNLGLRDVVHLAERLIEQHESRKDLGDPDFLNDYSDARQQDHDRTIQFTDQLIRVFSNDWFFLAAARNAGLVALDHLPAAKTLLARHAMGLAGRLPLVGSRRLPF